MSTRTSGSATSIRSRRSGGVTLIELMVALVIGSLLIVGAVAVYVQSRNTYRVIETAARLQEVARYALSVIEPDVRLAGFWGLTFGPEVIDNRLSPDEAEGPIDGEIAGTNCDVNWVVNAEQYIEGRDAGYDLDCPVAASNSAADWTDVLIIRRASSDTRPLDDGRIQVQTNRMHGQVFSDGVIPPGFGPPPASETRDLIVHAYYVAEGPALANGTRQFSLRRQTLVGGTNPDISDVEVIPGIQDLQVQFGIDEDADASGSTDRYVDPESVPVGARVTSVRIWLLAVAEDIEVGFENDDDAPFQYANTDYAENDAFKDDRRRVLLVKTIQLRNSHT